MSKERAPAQVADVGGGLRQSLRLRLAVTFALFGSLVSLIFSGATFLAAKHTNDWLMDQTLRAEQEDYRARRARNPGSLPPATLTIQGYLFKPEVPPAHVPLPVRNLRPGTRELVLDGVHYRVSVEDQGGERSVMLFNETRHRDQERIFMLGGTFLMALVSAGLGWWLAGGIVAPVAELARLVSSPNPEEQGENRFPNDEIGKLASAVFGEYVKRMRAFIARERAFTSDVSHELRTPLSILRGVVELMEDDARLDARQKDRVERIRRAVDGMADITSALLVMAREESRQRSAPVSCDVCQVVEEVVRNHRHLVAPDTEVKLVCEGRPEIPVEATLLKIVLANLVLNALVNTDSGAVTVTVEGEGVVVTDTGRGISEEEIERVFQRHYKGAQSSGAGIGLSLVKRICDRYGWEILIHSAVGTGTRASLLFGTGGLSVPSPVLSHALSASDNP